MRIQVNTDRHIKGHKALATSVRATPESALSRFSDQITRVEVHVNDENGDKRGQNDKTRRDGSPPRVPPPAGSLAVKS